jgi:uncharacterized protein (TIGR02246 family)
MTTHDSGTDEAAIRQLIEDWAAAVRKKNLAGILAHHASDIVMFDVPAPIVSRGIAAYEATWKTFFNWSDAVPVFDIDEMHVVAGTDVAFAYAMMHCAGTEKSGEHIDLAFRLTVGLRKIDGAWTMLHEHHSIPAD